MTNVTVLVGRWVRDCEVMTVGDKGTTLAKNTIAVDHPYKKDNPAFLRVVMWGKTGELANQYTSKGSQIAIEGHLETGSYEDKDGKKIFTTDVVANSVKFLNSKPQGGQAQQPSNDQFNTGGAPIDVSDDDLPF